VETQGQVIAVVYERIDSLPDDKLGLLFEEAKARID
jgi:hypothetical protein